MTHLRLLGRLSVALAALSALGGCLGQSPSDKARAALGPDPSGDEGSPEHRVGQPCLVCHGGGGGEGGRFAVAGTVFQLPTDTVGIAGVDVVITDSEGRTFTAQTNSVGNFMVRVRSGLTAPVQRSRGQLDIPWQPAFPLRVVVQTASLQQTMRSLIEREGSCAGCHTPVAGAASVGRVYLTSP